MKIVFNQDLSLVILIKKSKRRIKLPEHDITGDHVDRAVLGLALLRLVLGSIERWCDELSLFVRTLSVIYRYWVGSQACYTLHRVVVYGGVVLRLVIQTTQKPKAALQAKSFPNTFVTNEKSLNIIVWYICTRGYYKIIPKDAACFCSV